METPLHDISQLSESHSPTIGGLVDATRSLREIFKLSEFRPQQRQIITNILDGKDLLVLLPTGSGKSLCYQLPATMTEGLTIVISPLLALINDQLLYLRQIGIKTAYFNSQTPANEKHELFKDLTNQHPTYKLLYTTPESIVSNCELKTLLIQLSLRKLLARCVIDEAHCVSNWGHEFRASYLELKQLKTLYNGVQVICFTATATPKVQMDIIRQLGIKKVHLHRQSFIRHNLSYRILPKTRTVVHDMAGLIRHQYPDQTGIIYCLSRKNCEDVSCKLQELGLSAEYFHAGLNTETKNQIQSRWLNDQTRIIVATIAFGLGINKPDVRFVFHHSMPKSIEGYYQETGRAGRDGLPSDCVLFYSVADKNKLEHLIASENENAPTTNLALLTYMDRYCTNTLDCRKRQLSIYLGEYNDFDCRQKDETEYPYCDNCLRHKNPVFNELSTYVRQLQLMLDSQASFTPNHLMERLMMILPLARDEINRLINQLVTTGYLRFRCGLDSGEIREYYDVIHGKLLDHLQLEQENTLTAHIIQKPYATYGGTKPKSIRRPRKPRVAKVSVPDTPAFNSCQL